MLFGNVGVLLTIVFLLCLLTFVWGERNRLSLLTNHMQCLSFCPGRSFASSLAAAALLLASSE